MEDSAILEQLLALAAEAGLEVRVLGGPAGEGEPPSSGLCRLRDRVWVLLSRGDPVEHQIAVLCDALRRHAAELIEARYLPPAVRSRLASD